MMIKLKGTEGRWRLDFTSGVGVNPLNGKEVLLCGFCNFSGPCNTCIYKFKDFTNPKKKNNFGLSDRYLPISQKYKI